MSYKPDETVFMAYLYDELNPDEKLLVEKYLSENPDARKELEQLQHLRRLMSAVADQEVIAPPMVVEGTNLRFFWNAPYVKTIRGLAAS
jgi:anti-sigma factor RsiW